MIALSWEKERKSWSDALFNFVSDSFASLDKAQDMEKIRPDYRSLSDDQRKAVWCEVFSATAYYECGWNPRSAETDVGTQDDKDTWSVGMLQLSVCDQKNYGIMLDYDFDDLKDAVKNLKLGVLIMARQIEKHGKVLIGVGESGLYWATLHPGGKYDCTAKISAMVQGIKFT